MRYPRTIRPAFAALVMLAALAAVAVLGAAGCRRTVPRPEGMPPLYPCVIEVTFGGERIAGVGVLLRSADPAMKRWGAGGVTDAEGRVAVKTANAFVGAAKGEYVVSFSKRLTDADAPMGDEISLIPTRYERKNSTVTITVDERTALHRLELDGIDKER